MPPTTRSRAKHKQQDSDIEVVIKPTTNERQVNNKRINTRKRRNHNNNEWKWNKQTKLVVLKQNRTIIYNDTEDSDESVNTNNHSKTKKNLTKTKPKSKKTKKKPSNSNKKWTLEQDKILLKWMRRNPHHHKNKIKIGGLAGGLLRRSTTAVMTRIILLKNSMKEQKQKSKPKHINTNNNNKNKSDNDNDIKQNDDYNRIFNVLQKLNNGYDTQKRLTQNILNKLMNNENYEMNINIKDCKNITGFRIEYWETQLKCLEKKINKICKFSKLSLDDIENKNKCMNGENNNEESDKEINGVSGNDDEESDNEKSINGCDVLMDVNDNSVNVNSNNMVNDIEVDPNDLLRNPWLSHADERPRKRRKFY